jgi:hypothetical protein
VGVGVPSQLVQDPPIAHVALGQNLLHGSVIRRRKHSSTKKKQESPERFRVYTVETSDCIEVLPCKRQNDGDNPEEDVNSRDEREAKEPEPEQDVDLFVDNVERKHAEAVELLLPGSSAHAVKGAAEVEQEQLSKLEEKTQEIG